VAGGIDWKREFLFPQAYRPPINMGTFGIIVDSEASGGALTDGQLELDTDAEAASFDCRSFATPVRIVSTSDLDIEPLDLWVQPEEFCGTDSIITITSDAEGTEPYGGALPINGYLYRHNTKHSLAREEWGLNPEPFHIFSCTDSAANVRARIKVMVQEWNTVDEFERFIAFTESPPATGPGAVDPDERNDPSDNNLKDWKDLKDHRVGGVVNGGMIVYPYVQPGFPDGTSGGE
jgi:hypothetical protein